MTRLWGSGAAIRVTLQEGKPARFVWESRTHPVQAITNHWRVDMGWWRLRLWRHYYKAITSTGLLVVIYHDLISDQWWLQRVYD
jgi:hypothetical protein